MEKFGILFNMEINDISDFKRYASKIIESKKRLGCLSELIYLK